jgi:hypothetical protein
MLTPADEGQTSEEDEAKIDLPATTQALLNIIQRQQKDIKSMQDQIDDLKDFVDHLIRINDLDRPYNMP